MMLSWVGDIDIYISFTKWKIWYKFRFVLITVISFPTKFAHVQTFAVTG